MTALKDLEFSDLILAEENPDAWFMKGTPELGQGLRPVDLSHHEDVRDLLSKLRPAFLNEEPSRSQRIGHDGLSFRAALFEGVARNRVYFLRRLAETVPDFTELGILKPVTDWLLRAENSKGLVLFAGPQCAGKTTSAAAYVKARLELYGGHAVSFEHPVEMPLAGRHGKHGYCAQSEIHSEAELPACIERAHRYSAPNIVFIGEIRTKHAATEALRIALGSSRQIVVATIHGISLCASLDRLLTWAREVEGSVAHQNLEQTLLAIVFQEIEFNESFGTRTLNAKEFLLVPFANESVGIRKKLGSGNVFLDDDIREQRNRIMLDGHL